MAEPILPPESADAHAHLREPSNLRQARAVFISTPKGSEDISRMLTRMFGVEVIEGEFTVKPPADLIGNNPARR